MAEVKSRYEVIAELEESKRDLILEKEGFPDKIKHKKRIIRDMKRTIEDSEEELADFEKSVVERKNTITELIKSIDDSLARFTELSNKK